MKGSQGFLPVDNGGEVIVKGDTHRKIYGESYKEEVIVGSQDYTLNVGAGKMLSKRVLVDHCQ